MCPLISYNPIALKCFLNSSRPFSSFFLRRSEYRIVQKTYCFCLLFVIGSPRWTETSLRTAGPDTFVSPSSTPLHFVFQFLFLWFWAFFFFFLSISTLCSLQNKLSANPKPFQNLCHGLPFFSTDMCSSWHTWQGCMCQWSSVLDWLPLAKKVLPDLNNFTLCIRVVGNRGMNLNVPLCEVFKKFIWIQHASLPDNA